MKKVIIIGLYIVISMFLASIGSFYYTWQFWAIIGCVAAIDLLSFTDGLNK